LLPVMDCRMGVETNDSIAFTASNHREPFHCQDFSLPGALEGLFPRRRVARDRRPRG
jgi:hypothetical protein